MATKKTNTHICSECLGDFAPKDLFIGCVPNREYSTFYCGYCITKLEIMECSPYLKPRAPRKPTVKKEPVKKEPKGLVKKAVVKKVKV